MLTKAQIIDSCRKPHQKASDEELRSLPYKEAFIYGRVSSLGQVRDSKESIREIARLVKVAIDDGYTTNLVPSRVEEWLDGISRGSVAKGVLQDGQITVDVRDLGISGQLMAEDREGLAALQEGISSGRTGAAYVSEGVGRISRDRDRILPYQLLKLLKEHQVRVRTPEGIWNPAIERDWEYLAEEFEEAASELKTMNKRMFRRKAQKAARGEFVGEPIPTGFIVPVVGQRPNGQYEYGKYKPYPPHAEIATQVLQEYVRSGGRLIKTMDSVRGLVFPFFPPELRYMEHLSSLRNAKRLDSGYEISPGLVMRLATNPKMIGVWHWGSSEPIPDNHPAAVPEEVFTQAFELAERKGKPKGRAASSEPLEWSGLLYCQAHTPPRRVISHSIAGYYSCERDYKYARGPACFFIKASFLDEPLSQTVLGQLELEPCIEDVISSLQSDASRRRLDQFRDQQQISRLEREVKTLKALLPCCVDEATGIVDREKEAHYWEQIRAVDKQIQELKRKPASNASPVEPDYARVRDFLKNLPAKWRQYSRSSRNRFVRALIDRVELRGKGDIEAVIYWKAGFRQQLVIHRTPARSLGERRWTQAEKTTLARLFQDSPREAVMSALPKRSWMSIASKAKRLNLARRRVAGNALAKEPSSKLTADALVAEQDTQVVRSGNQKVQWEIKNVKSHQSFSSGRPRGIWIENQRLSQLSFAFFCSS